MTEPSGTGPPRRGRLADVGSLYVALILVAATIGGFFLLLRLRYLLIVLFLALLVACGIAGPVRRLERRGVPRGLAIGLVYLAVFAVVGGIGWYVVPRLVGQAGTVADDLPERVAAVRRLQARFDDFSRDYPFLADFDARLLRQTEALGPAVSRRLLAIPGAITRAVFTLFSVFTIAALLLTAKERLRALIVSLFHPRHRDQTGRVLDEMGLRLGAYLRAKLAVMTIVGALIWLLLFVLGSPYAILVALFAGVLEAIPRVGPLVGRAAILLAVVPLGWDRVLIAFLAHIAIANFKGYVLSPAIEGNQLDIHPLTAFVAIIAGGSLLGWLGALVAVPIAAVVQVLVEDVLLPWRRGQLAAAEAGEQSLTAQPPLPKRGRGGATGSSPPETGSADSPSPA